MTSAPAKKPTLTSASVAEYLDALVRDPRLAIIPINAAAEGLGVARTSIERMMKDQRLTEIAIPGARGVAAYDIADLLRIRRAQIDQVRSIVEHAASKGETVSYETVMAPLGLDTQLSIDRARIGQILGKLSVKSHEDGILLSVLVHKKSRPGKSSLPSSGFFELARSLKFDVEDDDVDFVHEQMELVFKFYRKRKRA